MKRILLILTMAINAFFGVMVHGQTVPTEQPQRVQHPYYQYDGFIEAKKGILLPRRIANFTPKSPVLIYDTVSGKVSVYVGGWKSLQNVSFTADYNDLINRPDLTQYVPTSRTINGYSLTSNITINKVDIGLGNVQNVDVTNAGNITSGTFSDARLSGNVTLQGNTFNGANQLLQLDAGGKVAYANLPAALMIYKGVWDASTNTPTLADGSGVNGWVYRVHPGGTVNFGSGNITFSSGDYVIYNGSVWQKSGGGDAVTSVNGQQGVVVLTTANIAEGGTNYYYTNTRVQTFGDTRYSLLNHEHVYADIANLSSYTGFDVRYKSISYVPAWSDITGKPSFATVATSGAYSDLSGTPTLGSLAALSSIGNTYITDVAWSKVTGAPSFLTSETDPTIYAWAKASVKPSYTYAEIGGTVPTWNQNTTGNAATATTAANSTLWASNAYSGGAIVTPSLMMMYESTVSAWRAGNQSDVRTFLGLGSAAYTASSAYYANGSSVDNSILWNNYSLDVSTSYGSGFDFIFARTNGSAQARLITLAGLQSWLGLGSYAYRSSGLAELSSSPTFTGTVTAPQLSSGQINATGPGGSAVILYGSYSGSPANAGMVINNYLGTTTFSHNSNGGATTTTGAMTASAFYGAGIGLTGYASSLSIGGYSNSFYANGVGSSLDLNSMGNGWYTNYGSDWFTNRPSGADNVYGSVWQQVDGSNGFQQYFDNRHGNTNYGDYWFRTKNASGFSGWSKLLHSNNYNLYAPTLTGTGASGTWGINITGSAGSVAWTNVTSRPTAVSAFTNDAGYITSAVTSIAGTSNQIAVSAATGSVTVSLTNNVVIPGTITSSASYESSDRRLKRALSGTRLIGQIESLQARLYEKDGRDEYGYYAQDALKIIPTAVKQRADGYYDLSYTQVFVVKIASLEKRVSELETLLQKIYGK